MNSGTMAMRTLFDLAECSQALEAATGQQWFGRRSADCHA
jgi:hypothetical protein